MNLTPVRGIDVLPNRRRHKWQNKESGTVEPRRRPVYPISAERELARYTLAYMNMIIRTSQPVISSVMKSYEDRSFRQDDAGDFISSVRGMRFRVAEKLSEKTGAMEKIEKGYNKCGNMAKNHSINDWNDLVKDALGMQVNKEYYEDSMQYMVDNWIRTNVSKIQSIPAEYLAEVEKIIRWGYETRQPKVNVYRRLEKQIGMSRSKAVMIGRDQMGSLNAQLTQYEHESAGVSKYKWVTKRDDRVRDCHRALHGTVHDWKNPPEMWYMTKHGVVYTGRFCNPGEDYACRCTASPVFDLEGAKELLAQKFKPL